YGDLRRYEVTAELVPGWKPDPNVDNPADVDEAVAVSEEHIDLEDPSADPWYQRYHANGSQFPTYANVGRRWVLNETGRYDAASYARSSGPFDTGRYEPWEPSDCSILDRKYGEDGELVEEPAAAWARLARPFLPCFSADANRRSLGVVAEASY